MEINEILLHIIPNGWGKNDFLHGFDFKVFPFNKVANIFEYVEIAESIYEGVVEHSTNFWTGPDAKHDG